MIYFFVALTALAISMVMISPLIHYGRRLALIDIPDERKVHLHAVPRVGGIAIALGTFLPLLLWLPMSQEYAAFLLALAMIFLFGLLDDWRDLSYGWKFLGQVVPVLIVVLYGGVRVKYLPLVGLEEIPDYISIPITVIAMIGVTNAVNLSDGLDGLAGGLSMLTLVGVAIMAYLANGDQLVMVALAIMGGIMGFLRYNTYPARIFMGDGGSQFLGFSAGVLVIILTQQVHEAMSPVVALFLLGMPILDTLAVMSQRILEGRSPFSADKNHIHHKLLALGLDHYEAVFIIYVAQATMVCCGYIFRYFPDFWLVTLYLAISVSILTFFNLAHIRGWKVERGAGLSSPTLSRVIARLRQTGLLTHIVYWGLTLLVGGVFLTSALAAGNVSDDIIVASILMLACLVLAKTFPRLRGLHLVEQVVVYATAVFTVYLVHTGEAGSSLTHALDLPVFVAMAVLLVVGMRLTRSNFFRVTPMDFLVLFLAILVPNLPDFHDQNSALATAVPKVILLFYGLEFVLNGGMPIQQRLLRYLTMAALLVVGLQGKTWL
ncbi:MAG: undecaprenyl/decaprenyl-phosphate alpha-N-acetylglucosaminyl 1-phosphate transferase [Gammaproteobacteria bacterium]|nr:undecaprenyl/decaprenyl-phosphate alpha-N-acetylglucosaminyl 1-phosphate transferase [Gammaproteobacteria bacterium]